MHPSRPRPTERFTQATLPMALLSLEGAVLVVNPALCKLVGRPSEDVEGRSFLSWACDDDTASAATAALEAARTGERGGEVVQQLRTLDGSVLQVRVWWTLVRDDEGGPPYLTAVFVDDTERLQAQRRLEASEARWRALLMHAADVTWTAEDDGTITWATSALTAMLGWQIEDVTGTRAVDWVHPDDREVFCASWERLVRREATQEVLECRVARAEGGWSWLRETLTDLRDDPYVGAIVGNVVDVTEHRRRARQQARTDEILRARFERSNVPQLFVDLSGRITAANASACAITGRSGDALDELLGLPLQALTHSTDPGAADLVLHSILSGATESAQVERVLCGPGGRPLPVRVDVAVLRDERGEPYGAGAYLYDLTSLRDAEDRRQRQEDLHLALTRNASDLALVSDGSGRIVHASSALERMLGYTPEQVLGRTGATFVHPEDVAAGDELFAQVVARGGSRTLELRVRAADGSWRWVEETVTNLLDTAVGGIVTNLRDITERVEAERSLRRSEARYRAIVDTAEEGIWAATPDGGTLYANGRLAEILGRPLEEIYALPAAELFAGPAADFVRSRLTERGSRGTERYEVDYEQPDGGPRRLWVAASPLRHADGSVEGSLAMVSDITEQRRLEQDLRHAALHDELTGLPNRALLMDRIEHALSRAAPTAVLFLDLDHFKLVNDSRGHAAGDDLLVAVAQRLAAVARRGDTVARFGGDEFVVVCEDVDHREAAALAEDVLAALRAPFELDGRVLHVAASVGVALSPAASAGELLRYADTAMYAAKAEGRGRVRHVDLAMTQQAEERHVLAGELRLALAEDALEVHYQPVVDLTSGAVVGVEALSRWTSELRGPVPPATFVSVAEMTGLAGDLDRWVLARATRDAGALRTAGLLPPEASVAVNLSPHSLTDPGLEEHLLACVQAAGLPASALVLEITEGAIMSDPDVAITVLRRLRSHGFPIAVDDFGTGYSSLAYLRDLPVTCLKVDRSFITGIADDRDALAIVASIVDLARAVGIDVIAEGVETGAQAAVLRRLGCSTGQGWLWSPAVPLDQVRADAAWSRPYDVTDTPSAPAAARGRDPQPPVAATHGLDRLLELHRAGASLATVASALNSEGYRTRGGVRWHRTSVARAVAESAYPELGEASSTVS